jgi:cytoskeletal protein CcmA (bactofilin family)
VSPRQPGDEGPPVIAAGAFFEGVVAFRGRARVQGEVRGGIVARGTVEIGSTATVRGNVDVDEAVVAGEVNGEIRARERIELRAGARVEGDLTAPRLCVEDGSILRGRVRTRSPL